MKRLALTSLAIVAAFVIGRLTLAVQPSTHTERVVERQPIEHRVVQASSSLTAEDVRAIVNDALAARAPAPVAETPTAVVDPAALSQAQAVIASGMADGRWTDEDRDRLRGVIDHLSREQAHEAITTLFSAINAGRVRLDTVGPPT